MKGFTVVTSEDEFQFPQRKDKSIYSRLQRLFRGPCKQPRPKPQYRDEKKYHHVPTHSGSSFVKTATTADMITPMVISEQGKAAGKGPTEEQLIEVNQVLHHQQTQDQVTPSRSLI